jgi:hypothetical protein
LQSSITTSELVNFFTFDRRIEEHIEKVQGYAHTEVSSKNLPVIVLAVREWLIKAVGCFTTVGYVRTVGLRYWFNHETILQEFDELFLQFRDYLQAEKCIDISKHYNLLRYHDNLSFILVEGPAKKPDSLAVAPVVTEAQLILSSMFDKFIKDVSNKLESQIDVDGFIAELKGDNFEGLLSKYVLSPED